MKRKITYLGFTLLLIFVIVFFNCKHNKFAGEKSVLVGKIVNPKKDYFVVSQDPFNLESDTIFVSSGNKFKGSVQTPFEGLYFVYIFPEFQVFYLKPGDSIAFVLNTNEFDESLSFSGTSAMENNILVNLFLLNEKESLDLHQKFSQMTPEELLKKTDSFYRIKTEFIQSFNPELQQTSTRFKKILDFYKRLAKCRILESYAGKHKNDLPKDYFAYRKILQEKAIDPNILDLLYFIKNFVDNNVSDSLSVKERQKTLIELINKEVADQAVRDNMLMLYCKNYIKDFFIYNADDEIFKKYQSSIQNSKYNRYCRDLVNKNNALVQGKTIPDVILLDINGKPVGLKQILNKSHYLLSFSDFYYRKNYRSNYDKLRKIKEKFPDLQIIVINKNTGDFNEWKIQVPKDTLLQFYQFKDNKGMKKIFPYNLSKVYLLKKDSIKQSMINMYHPDFNGILEDFMKRP